MHIYIYDNFVSDKKYEKIVAEIETRITDLGLNGKIIRMGLSMNIFDTIDSEARKGAKTIVVVGGSTIFNQAINSLARLALRGVLAKNLPLGFIPITSKKNKIANYFGIGNHKEACDLISARRIEGVGLGLANDQYFITQAKITTNGTFLEIDKDYTIEILENGEIYIINIPTDVDLPEKTISSAKDNILELFIKTTGANKLISLGKRNINKSVFPFSELLVVNSKYPVILDDSVEIKTPVHVRMAKNKINLIVGKSNASN